MPNAVEIPNGVYRVEFIKMGCGVVGAQRYTETMGGGSGFCGGEWYSGILYVWNSNMNNIVNHSVSITVLLVLIYQGARYMTWFLTLIILRRKEWCM